MFVDAGHGLVVVLHTVNLFVGFLACALRVDANAAHAVVNQLFVCLVFLMRIALVVR
jgi:hypothetical protein